MVTGVKVFPQNLQIAFANEAAFPAPDNVSGLPLYDLSQNVLKFTDGTPGGFKPALPEHTLTGQHGPKVTITQTGVDNALFITQVGNASGINVVCGSGSGRGISITQAAPQDGIVIDKSNTSGGIGISVLNRGTGSGIRVDQSGAAVGVFVAQSGAAIGLQVNQAAALQAAYFNKTNASGGSVVHVNNAGIGPGIAIDQSGNGNALSITNTSQADAIVVTSTAVPTAGKGLVINHHAINGSNGFCMQLDQKGDAQALYIAKTGTGSYDCVDIVNSYGGCALNIVTTSSGTGSPGIQVQQYGNANALSIWQYGVGGGLRVEKVGTDGSDAAYIINNAGTGDALEVWQYKAGVGIHVQKSNTGAGDAILVVNSGSSACLAVYHNKASATVPAIYISNNATASNGKYDIYGNAGNWWIDRTGNANFRGPQSWFTFSWNNTSAAVSTGALGFYPRWATAMIVAQWPADTRWHSMSVGFATGTGSLARSACSTDHTDTDNVGDSSDGQSIGGHGAGVYARATTHPVRFVVQSWSASGIQIQPILTSSGAPQNIYAVMHLLVMG